MSQKEKREERRNLARRRAETHASGFEGTNIRIPDGLPIWAPKEGVYTIAIIPYTAKSNPNCEPGDVYYERTFWQWSRIGAGEGKSYCCLHKTFGKPDPVADWKSAEARNPSADQQLLKDLTPKERQLFLVFDKKDEKLYLWECSYHLFGKLLDSRIQNSDEELGWDWFYFTDDTGSWLRLTFEETSGGGYSWTTCTAIDFLPRKAPLPEKVINHGICLDDLLVEKSYDELRNIFLCISPESDSKPAPKEDAKPAPKKDAKPAPKPAPKEDTKPESKPAPKEDTKPAPKIVSGMSVVYNGSKVTVLKVSAEGALTLEDEEKDEIYRNVSVAEVLVDSPKTPPQSETPSTKREEKASSSTTDDDWSWGDD